MTPQPDFIPEAYLEVQRDQSDKQLIDNFVRELDMRGWNLWILKAVRSLLKKGEKDVS